MKRIENGDKVTLIHTEREWCMISDVLKPVLANDADHSLRRSL